MYCSDRANANYTANIQSSVKNVFIRGSVVRYVHLPAAAVDTALLEDATRRGSSFFFSLFTIIVVQIHGKVSK